MTDGERAEGGGGGGEGMENKKIWPGKHKNKPSAAVLVMANMLMAII